MCCSYPGTVLLGVLALHCTKKDTQQQLAVVVAVVSEVWYSGVRRLVLVAPPDGRTRKLRRIRNGRLDPLTNYPA